MKSSCQSTLRRQGRAEVQQNFPIRTAKRPSSFLQHFIRILKKQAGSRRHRHQEHLFCLIPTTPASKLATMLLKEWKPVRRS